MTVVEQSEGGEKVTVMSPAMKLSHCTVSAILKDKDRIPEDTRYWSVDTSAGVLNLYLISNPCSAKTIYLNSQ
ncbi:hypothetical protein E2C01_100023 [Portunus trituberculatus]|uniref:Uncharacterized protein n=1 Tax=Portunus trituberculatus TaxID=210409 RepID=A0A5B7K1W4_PORTR|nr:hypothetical protein [Portunus trituberculatus]